MKLAVIVLGAAAVALAACQTAAPPDGRRRRPSPGSTPWSMPVSWPKRPTNEAQANVFAKLPRQHHGQADEEGEGVLSLRRSQRLRLRLCRGPGGARPLQGMQNTMDIMTQQMPGSIDQIDPGLSPDNIDDLGTWAPL